MLGLFHTFMNILGAIGTLMNGSGLQKILETVFAENSVSHMLTGKAVSRAFRGHLIVDFALTDLFWMKFSFQIVMQSYRTIYSYKAKQDWPK